MVQGDLVMARSLSRELNVDQARFAVVVVAELLIDAIRTIAMAGPRTADEIWQATCARINEAVNRASIG
jgi:hypothetical protein